MHPERRLDSIEQNSLVTELTGFLEMGMKREAFKLARSILAKPVVEPAEFACVMNTIGALCDTTAEVRRWREKVEAAYARQSKKRQRSMNEDMLRYYHCLDEFGNALRHVSAREKKNPQNAFFIMEALLEGDRLQEARRFARLCDGMLKAEQDRFQASVLIEALASYKARTGEWHEALYLWCEVAPIEQPFRENAARGAVSIHLARALHQANTMLKELEELRKDSAFEDALALPGNDEKMTRNAEKTLLKFKRGIEKLLPKKMRKRLGLEDEEGTNQ